MKIKSTSARRFFPLSQRGSSSFSLVSITVDASVVVLGLRNMNVCLLPLRLLLPITWGRSGRLAEKPTIFSFDSTKSTINEGASEYAPASMCCFDTRNGDNYLVIGDTRGYVSYIDLQRKVLLNRIVVPEGIRRVENFICLNTSYISVITQNDRIYALPLESNEMSLCDTLAFVRTTSLCDLSEDRSLCYININSETSNRCSKVAVVERTSKKISISDTVYHQVTFWSTVSSATLKELQFLLYSKLTIFSVFDSSIYIAYPFLPPLETSTPTCFRKVDTYIFDSSKILGLLPSFSLKKENELDECLIIASSGAAWLRPKKTWFSGIYSVIADSVVEYAYQSKEFCEIAENLNLQAELLFDSVLETVLTNERSQNEIDGLISLAFEIKRPIVKIVEILARHNKSDLLLPFLQSRCAKNPSDGVTRQLLFNAYIGKLSKLDSVYASTISDLNGFGSRVQTPLNEQSPRRARQFDVLQQRDEIEQEIRQFLIRHITSTATVKILSILLKHSLWSCVAALLSSETPISSRSSFGTVVARHLAELPNWRDLVSVNAFLKCLPLVEWPPGEPMGQVLVSKMIHVLPCLSSPWQFQTFFNIADTLLKRSMSFATALFLVSAICLLESVIIERTDDGLSNVYRIPKISCGSNCTAAVVDGDNAMFWGEFVAGSLRLSNDKRKRRTASSDAISSESSPKRCEPRYLSRIVKSKVSVPRMVALPRLTKVFSPKNHDAARYKVKSVACGTEHILLLTTDNHVISWGQNRYGQCGNGTNLRITEPEVLRHLMGAERFEKPVAVFAGHYHSALLTDSGEVWLWGWATYGQLATGDNVNRWTPTKTTFIHDVAEVCLGYAHTLFLQRDGSVWGCGALANGQLGWNPFSEDARSVRTPKYCTPDHLPRFHTVESANTEAKMFALARVVLPLPATLLSTRYFHGVSVCIARDTVTDDVVQPRRNSSPPENVNAKNDIGTPSDAAGRGVSVPPNFILSAPTNGVNNERTINDASNKPPISVIYEWGECPQSIRMRAFLIKSFNQHVKLGKNSGETLSKTSALSQALARRLKASCRLRDQLTTEESEGEKSNQSCSQSSQPRHSALTTMDMTFYDHFRVRRCCEWRGAPIRQLSAGFNHSAFVTERGELYTWGQNLEMQLGHGDKKDRDVPTRVHLAGSRSIKWSHVECARNYTVAVSENGHVYTWGRNDRNQLGLASRQSAPAEPIKVRRIALKPKAGSGGATKYVELPTNVTNVAEPTRLFVDVSAATDKILPSQKILNGIAEKLKYTDQNALNSASRFFSKNPISERLQEELRRASTCVADENTDVYTTSIYILAFEVVFAVANMHVSAGELLRTIDILIGPARLLHEQRNFESTATELPFATDPISSRYILGKKDVNISENLRKKNVVNLKYRNKSEGRIEKTSKVELGKTTNKKNKLPSRTIVVVEPEKCSGDASRANNSNNTTLSQNLITCEGEKIAEVMSLICQNDRLRNDRTQRPTIADTVESGVSFAAVEKSTMTSAQNKVFEKFDELLERIWNLVRMYPLRDIQTIALLTMLRERFPIHHRLAADTRLCRMIDAYVGELRPKLLSPAISRAGSPNRTTQFNSGTGVGGVMSRAPSRLSELCIRDRHTFLQNARLVMFLKSSDQHARLRTLRQKCDLIAASQANRFRFYVDCGHYERCVIESGASKQKISVLRNRLRKCGQCVVRSRYTTSGVMPGIRSK